MLRPSACEMADNAGNNFVKHHLVIITWLIKMAKVVPAGARGRETLSESTRCKLSRGSRDECEWSGGWRGAGGRLEGCLTA